MKTTVHRIKEFIDYKGISVRKLELKMNFSNGSFASQFKNNKNIGVDKVENILHMYPEVNSEWLLTGNGGMLKEIPTSKPILSAGAEGIPLVSATAIGGFGGGDFSIEKRDVKAYYKIPKFSHKNIDFMIEVEGSSMYPKYNSGDVVACTIIKESNFIQWNKVHVIATKDQGIIIKRIKKSERKNVLK